MESILSQLKTGGLNLIAGLPPNRFLFFAPSTAMTHREWISNPFGPTSFRPVLALSALHECFGRIQGSSLK